MSQKMRPFKIKYTIEASGMSRGIEENQTFQERMVDISITALIDAIKHTYKTIKIKVEKI